MSGLLVGVYEYRMSVLIITRLTQRLHGKYMEISDYASKFKDWEEQYGWETCKTNRKEFGSFIAHFLTTESRVINLDGVYGSGKTEFIRRLYVELAKKKHPVVYIDVWESDFSSNPLAVICSELLQQIEFVLKKKAPNGKVKEKGEVNRVFNNMKGKLGICLKYLEIASAFTGEPVTIGGTKAASKAVSAMPDLKTQTESQKYVETVQRNHINAVQAVKEIKKHITSLSELIEVIYELNIPIVILIDELDRCKPTYAIEVLEVIKHFFEAEGCTFLVATNTSVLEHSVKSVYGQDFAAKMYLRKFFDRKINLPQVSLFDYLMAKELDFDKYKDNSLLLYPFTQNQIGNIGLFAALFEVNGIELRDVEQILNRFFASLDYALNFSSASSTLVNTAVLMMGIIEHHLDKPELRDRTNNNNLLTALTTTDSETLDYSLSNMIKSMLRSVTMVKSKVRHSGNGNTRTYPQRVDTLSIQATDFSTNKLLSRDLSSNNLFVELIAHASDANCNYWMWENYQKVIELSGHIE